MRLRRGRARLLVPDLAVDDRREAVLRVAATFFHTFSTEPHVVSTSVQPCALERAPASPIVTPNAGRITTSSGPSVVRVLAGIGQEADALRAQLVVDVRVVDDLAGQEDAPVREALARLIGVVDGAVDAVAEAELAREVDGQPARCAGRSRPSRTSSTMALW